MAIETVRIIRFTNGDDERIHFTCDLEQPTDEFVPDGWAVEADEKVELNTTGFPLGWTLSIQKL